MATHRTETTWLSSCGVLLKIEPVGLDEPQLIEHWWPLHRAARTAGAACMPPVIHLDEFRIVGIVRRSRAGLLWIYLHRQSERELFVSEAGDTFCLQPFSTDRIRGRFEPCPIELAIHQAGLATLHEIYEHMRAEKRPSRARVRDFGRHIDGPRCYDVNEAPVPTTDAPGLLEPTRPTIPLDPEPNAPATAIPISKARRRPRPPVGPRPRASAPRQPRPAGPLRLVWPTKGPAADPVNLN